MLLDIDVELVMDVFDSSVTLTSARAASPVTTAPLLRHDHYADRPPDWMPFVAPLYGGAQAREARRQHLRDSFAKVSTLLRQDGAGGRQGRTPENLINPFRKKGPGQWRGSG